MKKKILICGGTGFIGQNSVITLSKNKTYQIYATYFKSKPFKLENVKWIKADLRNEKKVKRILKGIDVVIQAAATTSGSKDIISKPFHHVTDNAIMNSLILRACHENKVKKFIFFSCTVMYHSSNKPLRENEFKPNKEIFKNYFGVGNTKIYIENMCNFYAKLGVTKCYAIRHSNIYGPFDKFDLKRSHFIGATINKVFNAKEKLKTWGKGSEKRDFLYVDDLMSFLIRLLDYDKTSFEILNCSYGKSFSIHEIIKKIIKLSNKKLKIIRELHQPTIQIDIAVSYAKAKKILKWEPKTKIEEGLFKTLLWYKENEFKK
jgi:nucleoside-diphosphate-sugar epimerase